MKILIISDTFPEKEARQQIDWNLANYYTKKGHSVSIVTSGDKKKRERLKFNKSQHEIYCLPSSNKKRSPIREIINPLLVLKLGRIIKKIRPDIVHIQKTNREISYSSIVVSKIFCSHVFFTAHDLMSFHNYKLKPVVNTPSDSKGNIISKNLRKIFPIKHSDLVKLCLKKSSVIFAVSKNLKEILNANGLKNVEVVYNGVDQKFWSSSPKDTQEFLNKYKISENVPIVFYAGTLDPQKSVGNLLRAMELVAEKLPEAILILAGDEKQKGYTEQIRKFACEHSINVVFTGRLNARELRTAYHLSDLTVSFSILNPYSMVALESMTVGTPVVWGCRSGSEEVLPEYKSSNFVSDVTNPHLISESIIRILQDKIEHARLVEASSMVAKRFTLDSQTRQFLDYYKKAIADSANM